MMAHRTIKIWIGCLVLFSACYYDVEETLYPPSTCDTENMSYQADIVPILQQNCFVCHSVAANLGDITLEGYTNLMQQVNNGQLLGAIKHQPGFTAMPQGAAQLRSCDIAKIEQWITDGSQNN